MIESVQQVLLKLFLIFVLLLKHCYMMVSIIILMCEPCASSSLKSDSFIELLLLNKYAENSRSYMHAGVFPPSTSIEALMIWTHSRNEQPKMIGNLAKYIQCAVDTMNNYYECL